MCGITITNVVHGGQPSDGTRQRGITPGNVFKFYINEGLDTFMNLPVGVSLNCSKLAILLYGYEIL